MITTIEQLKATGVELEENPTECGNYIAYGNDGHTYKATLCDMGEKLNTIFGNGCGVMYFCIPATVKVLGYVKA